MITVVGPILNGDGSVVTSVVRFHPLELPGLAQGKVAIDNDVLVTPKADGSFSTALARGRWRVSFPTTRGTIDLDVPGASGISGQNEAVAFADLLPLEVLLAEGASGAGYRVESGFLELWNAEQEKFFPVSLTGAAGAEQFTIATEDRNVLRARLAVRSTVRANRGRLELWNGTSGQGWQPVFLKGAAGALHLVCGERVTGPLLTMPAQTVRVRAGILEVWSGEEEGWFPVFCAGAAGAEAVAMGARDEGA
jgi:hypothetical protein